MGRANNVRIMDKEMLDKLKSKFRFEVNGDYIIVHNSYFNRPTMHPLHKDFKIYFDKGRSVNINYEIIDLWINYFADKYNLLDIQNAYNILRTGYQDDLQKEDIENVLNKINKE